MEGMTGDAVCGAPASPLGNVPFPAQPDSISASAVETIETFKDEGRCIMGASGQHTARTRAYRSFSPSTASPWDRVLGPLHQTRGSNAPLTIDASSPGGPA